MPGKLLDPLGDNKALPPKSIHFHRGLDEGTLKISTGKYGSQHRCLILLKGSTIEEDVLEEVTGLTFVWQSTAKYHGFTPVGTFTCFFLTGSHNIQYAIHNTAEGPRALLFIN